MTKSIVTIFDLFENLGLWIAYIYAKVLNDLRYLGMTFKG